MPQTITKGYKALLEEANALIRTLGVTDRRRERALILHAIQSAAHRRRQRVRGERRQPALRQRPVTGPQRSTNPPLMRALVDDCFVDLLERGRRDRQPAPSGAKRDFAAQFAGRAAVATLLLSVGLRLLLLAVGGRKLSGSCGGMNPDGSCQRCGKQSGEPEPEGACSR